MAWVSTSSSSFHSARKKETPSKINITILSEIIWQLWWHVQTKFDIFIEATLCFCRNNSVSRRCPIKQFAPPSDASNYRVCKRDAAQYVATCPDYTQDWEVSKKCHSEAASFVYEGPPLADLLAQGRTGGKIYDPVKWGGAYLHPNPTLVELDYNLYTSSRKYKNSYCASCNSAGWLGCQVKSTVFFPNTSRNPENAEGVYQQYVADANKYMFVYRIDYNKRLCTRDSDSYIVYPHHETGVDTCTNITRHLRQCDCQSEYDIYRGICVPLRRDSNNSCLMGNSHVAANNSGMTSRYATNVCGPEPEYRFDLLSDSELTEKCSNYPCSFFIQFNSSSENITPLPVELPTLSPTPWVDCRTVFSLAYQEAHEFDNIYCSAASEALARCGNIRSPQPGKYCIVGDVRSSKSYDQGEVWTTQTLLQNSVAIKYEPTGYKFRIEDLIAEGGYDLLFATFVENERGYCSKFTDMISNRSEYLICPNNGLKDPALDSVIQDFYLQGDSLAICTEFTLPGFQLNIQDYVLSAISMIVVVAYLIYYVAKGKKTLTSYFVASSLGTLVAALISYCLINQADPGTTSCMVIASLNHYFMLGTHTWTNALAIWMFHGITRVQLVVKQNVKSYIYYAIYAWVAPLGFVILSYILNKAEIEQLYPVFSSYICFVDSGWIRLLLFTGPIFLLVLINVILCIIASLRVFRSGKQIATSDKRRTKRKIFTIFKLQVIFGFHWFLLYLTWIKGDHESIIWQTLGVLISLQGTLIVLAQLIQLDSCMKKVRYSVKKKGLSQEDSSLRMQSSGKTTTSGV